MSEGAGFQVDSVLEALRRIRADGLSGRLETPTADGPVEILFHRGQPVGLGAKTIAGALARGLEAQGVDAALLLPPDTHPLSLAGVMAIRPQVETFLTAALAGASGGGVAWRFEAEAEPPGEPAVGLGDTLKWAEDLVHGGLSPAALAKALPGPDTPIGLAAGWLQGSRGLRLSPQGGFVLSRLQEGLTIRQLEQSCGLPPVEVHRTLLSLELHGLIGLARHLKPAPPPPPAARAAVPTSPPAGPDPELLAEVDDLAIVAERGNLYDILGVPAHEDGAVIRKRFVDLTKRFHPDKFQQFRDPSLLARVNAVFTRITEAHEVLRDPVSRSAYDRRLGLPTGSGAPDSAPSPGAPPGPAPPPARLQAHEDPTHKAAQHFAHGKESYRAKRYHDATEHFREAVRMLPERAEYQFWLGRTLALNPQRVKEAEERLQEALRLQPRHPDMLLELARFYERVNLPRRAVRYYEQVLEVDPANAAACQATGRKPKQKHPVDWKRFLKMDLKDLFGKGKRE